MLDQKTPTANHRHEPDAQPDAVSVGEGAIHRSIAAAKDGVAAAGSLASRTSRRVVASARAVDGTLHAHPYSTLAVGVGLGILVGMLLRRSRRQH